MDFELLEKYSYTRDRYDFAYEFTKAFEIKAHKKEGRENEVKGIRNTISVIKRYHYVNLIRRGSQENN